MRQSNLNIAFLLELSLDAAAAAELARKPRRTLGDVTSRPETVQAVALYITGSSCVIVLSLLTVYCARRTYTLCIAPD
jgi:hypothetical protein